MLFVYSYLWLLTDSMSTHLQRARCRAQTGQGLVEYAMIIGLVAVVAVTLLTVFGGKIGDTFNNIIKFLPGSSAPCSVGPGPC